jgi:alcohol dehydrogenase (cytochrome c)
MLTTMVSSTSARRALLTAVVIAVGVAFAPAARSASGDWLSYNNTLTSERFSPLREITRDNVANLDVVCRYDTGQQTSFQTGPLMVDGTIYLTTESDTIALDASNCQEKWRVRESIPTSYLKVNRGVAYLDGSLFRGTQDGRVIAYDAHDGRKLWETRIADPAKGESVPAAPIAWSGLVFIGNAGGDNYGVKGRMYALDAKSGKVVWEFYLVPRQGTESPAAQNATDAQAIMKPTWSNAPDAPVTGGATWTSYTLDAVRGLLYVPGGNPAPDFAASLRPGTNLMTDSVVVLDARTGAYRAHYQLVPEDFHDWDVAAAPSLFTTPAGRRLLAATPKDGNLYVYDLDSGRRLYKVPVTTIDNAQAPLTRKGTHFCPGTQGGSEWNGPAYDPDTNLIYTGAIDWCSTVTVTPEAAAKITLAQPWTGSSDEQNAFGVQDRTNRWGGWLYAKAAETGETAWRFKAPAPILGGVTPTAGGLVFFGDMEGHAYAFDAQSGKQLWSQDLGAAVGGGVISYEVGGRQRIAFTSGLTSPLWPGPQATAKLVVFGLK